jgi:transposase-like protein
MNSGASSKKKDVARNVPDPSPVKGDAWVWRAIDVKSRLRVANHLSKTREIEDAIPFLTKIKERLGNDWVLFTTDKLKAYLGALWEVFAVDTPPPEGLRGRPRKRWRVFPRGLLYGQVDKEREHGHLRCVDRKAVIGAMAEIQAALDSDGLSKVINTSYVERDNLSVRQHNGRVVRKTLSYSKDWQMHQASIDFEDAVHNFVRMHSSLKERLPEPHGHRIWEQRTPAMAAWLTDHIWSIEELVTYRLPPRL